MECPASGFDPSLWFLAMDGDEIAGAALCWAVPSLGENGLGWVGQLLGAEALAPAWPGTGTPPSRLHRAVPAEVISAWDLESTPRALPERPGSMSVRACIWPTNGTTISRSFAPASSILFLAWNRTSRTRTTPYAAPASLGIWRTPSWTSFSASLLARSML